jgi:hypothetical protein
VERQVLVQSVLPVASTCIWDSRRRVRVRGDDLGSLAVHIAPRVSSLANREKFSSLARSRIWWSAQESASWTGTSSKACRGAGSSIGPFHDRHL